MAATYDFAQQEMRREDIAGRRVPPNDSAKIDADRINRHCGSGVIGGTSLGVQRDAGRPISTAGRLTFENALTALKQGMSARRLGWNGPGQYVSLRRPENSGDCLITEPYLYLRNAQGGYVPWLASQGDLLASDWLVF